MAKGFGKDDQLWVESATPGTFNLVKGQGDLSISRSRSSIDLSDKTTAGYKQTGYGLADLTLKQSVQPDLPDANGFTRLVTLCNAQPSAPFNIQVRKNGAAGVSPGDVIFAASVYGQITDQSHPTDGVREVNFEFGLAAAPTTDLVAA